MVWTEPLIHFLDFEGNAVSGVLEYGVVTLRGGRLLATHTRLCRAIGRVGPDDVAVHGLEAAAVAGCALFAEDFASFAAWRESGPFAAHFAGVENALLKSVWPYSRASPDFARTGEKKTVDWGPWLDSGRLYPQIYPQLGSPKLEVLVAAFGLQAELDDLAKQHCPSARRHYHAALYDALAGSLLLMRLAKEPGLEQKSLEWMIEMSTLNAEKREGWRQTELF